MQHIFDLWPSLKDLAHDLNKPYPTVASWRQRGSIPGEYDIRLIASAKSHGFDLTLEEIALAREKRWLKTETEVTQ